ncbi:MAG TPA: hypothetical protein VLA89_10175 [Gemmatimonadales bacterium]|nr:hypothetical protein [Gemmatimonadales bacterium]
MNPQDGTLVVVRRVGKWRDHFRAYRIEIDGTLRGKVREGETLTLELAPGDHQVQARIDWLGSPPLRIEIAQGATVECQVEPAGTAFQFHQLFGKTNYLRLTVREIK